MKIQTIAKLSGLATGLLLLAACVTTKVVNEWRDTDGIRTRFGHLMVVAFSKQDQNRRMLEDEFAAQISNLGPMSIRSYNLVPILNENTTIQLTSLALAVGADGILAIRMVEHKQTGNSTAGNTPPAPMNLSGFLRHAWEDNYDPPDLMTNTVTTIETRLFNAKNGKLVWSLATESQNQLGLKWELYLLVKRILAKLKDAMQTE